MIKPPDQSLNGVRDHLNELGFDTYTHVVLVFTRPPQGLGALVAVTMLLQVMFPFFSHTNVLQARLLARTDSGEVHEWVLNTDSVGMFLPMTDRDFIGVVDKSSMRVRGGGLLVAYAQWSNGPGWVYTRRVRDWDMVAKP